MLKSYTIIFIFLIHLIKFIDTQQQTSVTCPNFSYKCPDCKEGQFCSYPLTHGCEGSGMPVCQSKNCHNIICAPKALPCPDECPWNCQYHGPPCCPFIGQPTCFTCETFVPCKVVPCPSECPDNCFYPDADYCCPKSRQPICRSQLGDGQSSQQNKHVKRANNNLTLGNDVDGNDGSGSPSLTESAFDPLDNENENPICIDMIVPCPPECPGDCEYPNDVPCPKTHPPKCHQSTIKDGKDCHATTKLNKLVNELSSHHSSPPSTPVHSPTPIICPKIYIPCPDLCPTTCIRTPNAPCPFAVPGYCP